MKAKLFITALLLITSITSASANDAYIKVDANGNAIGGAIVCSADVCGDPNSVYSKLTLQPGERYMLQFKGDPVTGNVFGISATEPNITLKVNTETNEWTKTKTVPLPEPTTVVVNNTPVTVTAVQTEEKWNPTAVEVQPSPTPTVITTNTATTIVPETTSATNVSSSTATEQNTTQFGFTETTITDWFVLFMQYFDELVAWLETLMAEANQ